VQVLKDIQFQLVFLQEMEVSSCGATSRCVKVLRCTQCTILEGSLDIVVGKLSSDDGAHQHILNPHGADVLSPWVLRPPSSSASNSSISTLGSVRSNLRRPEKKIPKFELFDRFKTVVTKAVEFFVYSGKDFPFSRRLFFLHLILCFLSALDYFKLKFPAYFYFCLV